MKRTKCLVVCVLAVGACADEGITHINGPYPVAKADAGKSDASVPKKDAAVEEEEEPEEPEEDAGVAPSEDAGKQEVFDAGVEKDAGQVLTCPSGYECKDPAGPLAEMGLTGTITDPDGNPVEFSCAKGGQEECDPKDPEKSCPNFSEPYCAHLKLSVGIVPVDLFQCAQRCTP